MNKKLYIMIGVPGSGKSTIAKTLAPKENIFSTDSLIEATPDGYAAFFAAMNKSKDFSPLSGMHKKNLRNACDAMDAGLSPIVIDNTNLSKSECFPYYKYAKDHGYEVELVDVGTAGLSATLLFYRNKHNVPLAVIEKMVTKYHNAHYTEEDLHEDYRSANK